MDNPGRELRVSGGVLIVDAEGNWWTESRPQVLLVLTNSEFRVEQRFAWLSWTTFGWARAAPPGDPSGRKYLWSASWKDIKDVHLSQGFVAVRAPGRGACRFSTGSRSAARSMAEFLGDIGVRFESAHPTRRLIRRWAR
jgi:hypothetical protein